MLMQGWVVQEVEQYQIREVLRCMFSSSVVGF